MNTDEAEPEGRAAGRGAVGADQADARGRRSHNHGDRQAHRPARDTVRAALRSVLPPSYERALRPSKLDPFKAEVERLLRADPRIPNTRIRELIAELGHAGGKTILDAHLHELRPLLALGSRVGDHSSRQAHRSLRRLLRRPPRRLADLAKPPTPRPRASSSAATAPCAPTSNRAAPSPRPSTSRPASTIGVVCIALPSPVPNLAYPLRNGYQQVESQPVARTR